MVGAILWKNRFIADEVDSHLEKTAKQVVAEDVENVLDQSTLDSDMQKDEKQHNKTEEQKSSSRAAIAMYWNEIWKMDWLLKVIHFWPNVPYSELFKFPLKSYFDQP